MLSFARQDLSRRNGFGDTGNPPSESARMIRFALASGFVSVLLSFQVLAAPPIKATIAGDPEKVFDWNESRCPSPPGKLRFLDVPDTAPDPFKDASGQIRVLANHLENYPMVSNADLSKFTHPTCSAGLLSSKHDADPSQFTDAEWLASAYTTDGKTVYGIIHDEYHGVDHDEAYKALCRASDIKGGCWYVGLRMAISKDGGQSYERVPLPDGLIADPPIKFDSKTPMMAGARAPSNIIRSPIDGAFYFLVQNFKYGEQTAGGMCLERSETMEPGTWRKWDGKGFNAKPRDPYTSDAAYEPCEPVVTGGGLIRSVVWSPSLKLFIATEQGGRDVALRTSKDLIKWSTRMPLMQFAEFENHEDESAEARARYFTLLDPKSDSRNFDTITDKPYLYYVSFGEKNGKLTVLERDIFRIPVTIESGG